MRPALHSARGPEQRGTPSSRCQSSHAFRERNSSARCRPRRSRGVASERGQAGKTLGSRVEAASQCRNVAQPPRGERRLGANFTGTGDAASLVREVGERIFTRDCSALGAYGQQTKPSSGRGPPWTEREEREREREREREQTCGIGKRDSVVAWQASLRQVRVHARQFQ